MARTTKGRIFTRGKKGNYYLQYYINGKQFVTVLKDDQGISITKRREAEKAAEAILSPLFLRQEADRLEKVTEALSTAEQKAEAAEAEAANLNARIIDGWKLFYSCPKRPQSCKIYPIDEIPRTSTAANYRGYYRKFTSWIKKHDPKTFLLSDVSEDAAQSFIEDVKKKRASGTVNKYIQFFKCFFDTLINAGKITGANPFQNIDREIHRYNSRKPLTLEQIKTLLDNAEGELKILFALGYFTGLRRGDCCTLLWSEVDLIRGVIERIPSKIASRVKDKSQALVKIGIPVYLYNLLEDVPAEQRKGFILPDIAELYDSGRDYIITNRIAAHFNKCGIETRKEGTGSEHYYKDNKKIYKQTKRAITLYGFHSLRYSYISHNAEKGVPQAIIQRNAGHSSPAMTEHYTRISDKAALQYASRLELPEASQPSEEMNSSQEAESQASEAKREELKQLAETLSIEQIKKILQIIE